MTFPSIRLEGNILTPDLLDAISRDDKHSQKPADFGLDPSSKVKDEIASTWASAKALWSGYQAKIAALREGQTGVSETRNLFIFPLLALLDYQPEKAEAEVVNGKSYPISHRDISRDGFPLHIMGWYDSLEKKRDTGGPRISAHALVQEYLNLTEHSYGLITNGRQLRLLRDSSRLIKLSFLEFDLNRIFEEDLYADFAVLFRLIHATRMPANRASASGSVIEKYHQESVDSGSRIRDGLAAAVAFSMQTVANGLLAHSDNASLVEQLKLEPARANELHQNLLRWVYRTLFVLVIEERVLHHAPGATLRQRQLYRDYYSLQRLRKLADRPQLADRRAHDLWRAMHQTLRLYEDGGRGLPLGIAPLGSFLFREEGLQKLFQYQLDNRSLLQALNRLSTFTHPDTQVSMRVNYSALDVEEFGSVYESLLELRPRIFPEGEKLSFSYVQLAGNERKTTGSYYTPDSLVQCLLDSALDPVVDERLAGKTGKEAERALLSVKVCDPAVGSGHFLIGAAHRLAQRLADIRAGEEALSPDVQRHALRDVVSRCLYGVDINPLSVELCKVSLWMLGMEPGKPLGFLDHHIRCGNSLLGTTPELISAGLPDDAFKPIDGDDPEACSSLKKLNKAQREGLRHLFIAEDSAIRERMRQAAIAIDEISDNRPEDIHRKENAFRNAQQNYDFQKAKDLADLWCAAFVIKKQFATRGGATGAASVLANLAPSTLNSQPSAVQGALFGDTEPTPITKVRKNSAPRHSTSEMPAGVTTQLLRNFAQGGVLPDGLLEEARELADEYQFFQWHLIFPEVFAQGGFDLSLGNPPWDLYQFDDREFFASRDPTIANTISAKKRRTMAEELSRTAPNLYHEFVVAKQRSDAIQHLIHHTGRFPLTSVGRLNSAPLFAEESIRLLNPKGRSGIVVPASIAFDTFNRFFFDYLTTNKRIHTLFGFQEIRQFFPDTDSRIPFCLLCVGGMGQFQEGDYVFDIENLSELSDQDRHVNMSSVEMQLFNPNTLTCPLIRSSRAASILKTMYRSIPVIRRESSHSNPKVTPWYYESLLLVMLDSNNDELKSTERLLGLGGVFANNSYHLADKSWLPVLEGKMIDQYNHRFASYEHVGDGRPSKLPEANLNDLANPNYTPSAFYWLPEQTVADRLAQRGWTKKWVLAWRDVTNAASERTVRATITPPVAHADSAPLFLLQPPRLASVVVAALNSFVFDFVARQKIGGLHLRDNTMAQLLLPPPCEFEVFAPWCSSSKVSDWISDRLLELTYTAWDLQAFAEDCGWAGPPFRWEEERRFQLRCELDAAFFHLYLRSEDEWRKQPAALTQAFLTPRDAVSYIMDTFPIVKRKDEAKFNGDYRTKRTILEIYDALATAMRTGQPYQTRLDPPPADPRCCHPPKVTS